MQNKIFISAVVALLIGVGVGYAMGSAGNTDTVGMHRMPDGSMMHGGHDSMETMMHDMNAALRGKTGDEFDEAFLREMIVHHEGAVEMAEQVLVSSDRQEMKILAEEIISAQEGEISQMKQWQREWFGN